MRKYLVIILCLISVSLYAVGTTPDGSSSNGSTTMQSVNSDSYLKTGSAYSPSVYPVGTSSPSAAAAPAGSRKSSSGGGPGSVDPTTPSDYNPENTGFGPIGDAVLPLLLMAVAFGGVMYVRKRKARV